MSFGRRHGTKKIQGVRERVSPRELFRAAPRIFIFAKPHIKTITIGLIALVAGSGINLLFPALIRAVLNGEYGLSLERDILPVTIALVLLFAVQSGIFYLRHLAFQSVGYKVVTELRRKLFAAILAQDIAFFDGSRVGDLLSRLASDTEVVQRAITINVSVALRYFLQVVGGVCLMIYLSPRLSLVLLLIIPLLMVSGIYWGKKLRKLSTHMQTALGTATVAAEEAIGAIRTVRSTGGEKAENERFQDASEHALQAGIARTQIAAVFSSTMVFLMNSSIACAIGYGGVLVLNQSLSLGDLAGFLLYAVVVAVSFGFLVGAWDEFMQAVGASDRIFEILDSKPKVISPQRPLFPIDGTEPPVVFEGVSFSYPVRQDNLVLKDISFTVQEGATVALVGPSGSGKSTIANLLLRFYDPGEGEIRYRGVSLREIDPSVLRKEVGIVQQTPQVFSVSIGDNIRYAKPSASDEEVKEAAIKARVDEFVKSLPEGYNTLVGDRGIRLSGGERQRIAIARAFLQSPKLLILDEATSSLDSENEALVQQALEEIMKGRTTIVIAHRLSTVQHASEVLVLKDGAICQRGTHQTLMNVSGLYKTLVEHQLLDAA